MGFEQQLLDRLLQLLAQVDLAVTTERQLRKSLEAEFDCDLSEYKAKIRECVEAYLAENEEEEEDEGEDEEVKAESEPESEPEEEQGTSTQPAPEEKVPVGPLWMLSPEMSAFLGVDRLQRTQVLKKVWVYVKEHKLQNGKEIIPDAKLRTLFEFPLDGPGIMKQLGKHMVEKIEGSALPRPKKAGKRRASKAPPKEGEAKKPRAGGGFQKQCLLSDQLASFVGAKSMSRPETVKFFWNYIKTNELQDPRNKRNIISDENLKNLFGVERFQGFGMMKFINRHFVDSA